MKWAVFKRPWSDTIEGVNAKYPAILRLNIHARNYISHHRLVVIAPFEDK